MISPFRSTAFRIGFGQGIASLAVLALLAIALWWTTIGRLDGALTAMVEDDTRTMLKLEHDSGVSAVVETIREQVGNGLDEDEILLLTDPSLTRLAGNLPAWPIDAPRLPGWGVISIARGGGISRARVLHTVLPGDQHLLAGQDLHALDALQSQFQAGVGGAALMIALTAMAGALLFRRSFVSRVAQIDTTARAIVAGQLKERLAVKDERDELDLLAATINRMLDQIEQLIDGVRNVSNAIAHDLRTPLGELRTRLEGLLLEREVTDHVATEVEAAIEDTDRLIGTFNALLRLAELDSGARRSGFGVVDVQSVIDQAVELYQPLAESRSVGLSTSIEGRPRILGDPALLAQSIANLVDNALKFAPAGTDILVRARALPDRAVALAVADQGPGIPAAERPRATERFFRGKGSGGTQGVGLGLSMVAAIARLHGGELRLEDNGPGLRATLVLPPMDTVIPEGRG